jgi:hypothetical protein
MRFSAFIIVAILLTSCVGNRMYLTVGTKKKLEKAEVDLTQIQFYNSETIVLARQINKEEVDVTQGKVKFKNGKYVQEIIIQAGTPGICEVHDVKSLRVSFEDGSGNSIPFLVERRGGVISDGSGFKLGAKEWKKMASGSTVGKLDYQNEMFSIVKGANSRLLLDKTVLTKVDRDTRIAKGRKIG